MSEEFSALADGLMSYLASRAHDWQAWQIEENTTQLRIVVIAGPAPLRLMEKTVPLDSSPSQILDQILEEFAAGLGVPSQKLPQAKFPKVRNSLGVGAVK